jgi:hypothetical protein
MLASKQDCATALTKIAFLKIKNIFLRKRKIPEGKSVVGGMAMLAALI